MLKIVASKELRWTDSALIANAARYLRLASFEPPVQPTFLPESFL